MGVQLDTGGDGKGAKPNINVTPLVDVVLVLLIIFMVVIPNMQEGKTIEMINVNTPEETDAEDGVVQLTVQRDGTMYIDQDAYQRDALVAKLAEIHAAEPEKMLLMRGDMKVEYHIIRDLFYEAQQMGFGKIAIAVGKAKEWDAQGGSVG